MTDLIFSGQIFFLLWAGVVLAVCVVSVDRKNSSLVQLIMENHNLHYRDARDKMQQVFISDSGWVQNETLAFLQNVYTLFLRNFTKFQWNWSVYVACVVHSLIIYNQCWVSYSKKVRDSSPKNENSVINYTPSFRSKPVRPSFIFGTQIKIFLMKSESFLILHRQQATDTVKAQKGGKDIVKKVHVTSGVQP